jgi:secreted PhoX family phosphatase
MQTSQLFRRTAMAAALASVFALSACDDSDNGKPALTLDKTSVDFATVAVGASSSAQTVKLTNSGDEVLEVGAITASAGFTQTSNCGKVAEGSSCSVDIIYTPTADGASTGTLSITTNAEGSPATVALKGSGDTSATFAGIDAAATDVEKRSARATEQATIKGKAAVTGYHTILRSGEQRGPDAKLNVYGQIIDNAKLPVVKADGSTTIADSNDFSSLIKVGTRLFSVNHFESAPAGLYLTELSQDGVTGDLSALSTTAIDTAGINGLWTPCAGSVTPWNTHLGSEEYEPDAKKDGSANSMAPYFGGGTTLGGDVSKVNPYFWGFPVEVTISAEGTPSVAKHYSMGRFAHELSYVMPDNKTVYQTDDGTNVGFFMYVADTASNLGAGTLYAAKWNQTSAAGSSDLVEAGISWKKLGHATDAEIKTIIDGGAKFSTIFDSAAPTSSTACPSGYTPVSANGIGLECLSLKAGQEQAAAFLETRRYAGYVGATTEFRKEEGVTLDPDSKKLYVAYSELQYGMEDNKKNNTASTAYDGGISNDIKLLYNTCGGVYSYDLGNDATIGSDWVANKSAGVIAGKMTTLVDAAKANPSTVDAYAATSPYAGSTCSIDGISSPDNISYMRGQKTLIIGEDTGDGHQNDMVWSYNVATKALTRILTTPYGAESTSVYYYPAIGNFGYLMSVIQHPYGESDTGKVSASSSERRSYLGYVGPLPPYAQ